MQHIQYTVGQLAKVAGITPRALRHYDAAGLLSPSSKGRNGYRYYAHEDLLRLQQILFYRELDFPLDDIRIIMNSDSYDAIESLQYQRRMLGAKKRRLERIIKTIDETITNMKNDHTLSDADIYGALSTQEIEAIKQEAKSRWGKTDAYKQSAARAAKLTKDDWQRIKAETDRNLNALVTLMHEGKAPADPEVQHEIATRYGGVSEFYDCSMDMYRGLADMYLADERFRASYSKYDAQLPEFLVAGIHAFANAQEAKQ